VDPDALQALRWVAARNRPLFHSTEHLRQVTTERVSYACGAAGAGRRSGVARDWVQTLAASRTSWRRGGELFDGLEVNQPFS